MKAVIPCLQCIPPIRDAWPTRSRRRASPPRPAGARSAERVPRGRAAARARATRQRAARVPAAPARNPGVDARRIASRERRQPSRARVAVLHARGEPLRVPPGRSVTSGRAVPAGRSSRTRCSAGAAPRRSAGGWRPLHAQWDGIGRIWWTGWTRGRLRRTRHRASRKTVKPSGLCSPLGLSMSDEMKCLDPESNQGHGDFQSSCGLAKAAGSGRKAAARAGRWSRVEAAAPITGADRLLEREP